MRFFTRRGSVRTATLIDNCGHEVEAFSAVRDKLLASKLSINSVGDYLGHIARHIEFLYAVSLIGVERTDQTIDSIIACYESYLLHGLASTNELARKAAELTGKKETCDAASLTVIQAAIIFFLKFCDSQARERGKDGIYSQFLHSALAPIPTKEAAKLRISSSLASVVFGGARFKSSNKGLFSASKRVSQNRQKAQKYESYQFPLEKIQSLIDITPTYRDKAIYALLAGSGLRTSEGIQLIPDDVDVANKKVYVRNPFSRSEGLHPTEYDKFGWKGRESDETFLIEPWRSIFFDTLTQYFKYEYIPNCNHPFIFQTLEGKYKGRPYFASDRSDRISQFNDRAKQIGVLLPTGCALHSLRHAYGVYLLNYLPTASGIGLSLVFVSTIMGHSDIEITKVYARYDKEVIRAELEFANQIIIGSGNRSKKEMLISYYEEQLRTWRLM